MCPGSNEGEPCSGLPQQDYGQQVKDSQLGKVLPAGHLLNHTWNTVSSSGPLAALFKRDTEKTEKDRQRG